MIKLTVFLSVCFLFAGVAHTDGSAAVEQPVPDGACDPGTARFHKNGVLSKCKLLEVTEIQGYSCYRWVRFHPDGSLARFQADREIVLAEVTVPEKSDIFLDEKGLPYKIWFSQELEIKGLPVDGGCGKLEATFFENGKLKSCFLYQTAVIDGVPCKASVFHPVMFFPNGRLRRCTLARHHTCDGIEYKKGRKIEFDENGHVRDKDTE